MNLEGQLAGPAVGDPAPLMTYGSGSEPVWGQGHLGELDRGRAFSAGRCVLAHTHRHTRARDFWLQFEGVRGAISPFPCEELGFNSRRFHWEKTISPQTTFAPGGVIKLDLLFSFQYAMVML